jgi:hypothetical protein
LKWIWFVLFVSSVNQMLSACVIVLPMRPLYTSPTSKSSKNRPSQPFFSLIARPRSLLIAVVGQALSGRAHGALPAGLDDFVVAEHALRALQDGLLDDLAAQHHAADSRRDSLLERFRHGTRVLDFLGRGAEHSLMTATWLGWMAALPLKPTARLAIASRRSPSKSEVHVDLVHGEQSRDRGSVHEGGAREDEIPRGASAHHRQAQVAGVVLRAEHEPAQARARQCDIHDAMQSARSFRSRQ